MLMMMIMLYILMLMITLYILMMMITLYILMLMIIHDGTSHDDKEVIYDESKV